MKGSALTLARMRQMLMEAINSLEACARHGNAVIFYETVCNQSASDRARKLTERYERKEFAKRAMMKHIFKVSRRMSQADRSGAHTRRSRSRSRSSASIAAPTHPVMLHRGRRTADRLPPCAAGRPQLR